MFDRDIWTPMLEKLKALMLKQPDSKEKDVLLNTLQKLTYNLWHRSCLPHWCYATDIDFIEWTNCFGEIELRGLIETKHSDSLVTDRKRDWQQKIYLSIAKQLELPVWNCTFENKFSTFLVEQIFPEHNIITLSEDQYRKFQMELHRCPANKKPYFKIGGSQS